MNLTITRILVRHLAFYLLTLCIFSLFYRIGCLFLHWYDSTGLIRQLFIFFLLSSLIWLAASSVNYLIFNIANRIAISNSRTGFSLMLAWFLLAIASLLSAWMPVSGHSVIALLTEVILILEAAFYPVMALSRLIK